MKECDGRCATCNSWHNTHGIDRGLCKVLATTSTGAILADHPMDMHLWDAVTNSDFGCIYWSIRKYDGPYALKDLGKRQWAVKDGESTLAVFSYLNLGNMNALRRLVDNLNWLANEEEPKC